MKKVLSLFTLILLGFASFAQDTTPKSKSNPKNNLDTTSRPNNLPRDTTSKNRNNQQRPDSLNAGLSTMSSDSMITQNANPGTNSTMTTDSSMSGSNHNADSTNSLSNTNGNATSTTATANTSVSTADSIKAYEKTLTDRVMMKDDKMYMLKDGEATLLEKSYKLSSGAIVSTAGTVKYPGGKIITLKNGQFIEIKPAVTETKTKQVEKYKKSTKSVVTKKKTQSK